MALITRLSRLFKADFHAVIDQLEEPEMVLRQAVREMEEAVAKDDLSITRITQESEQLQRTITTISQRLEQTEDELDICFVSGEEALSKTLIKRKLECVNRQARLKSHLLQLHQQLSDLEEQQNKQKSILESMQQKVGVLAENHSKTSHSMVTDPDEVVTDADIEIAYLKEQQKRAAS